MGGDGKPHPGTAQNTAEFVATMRGLKDWSGMTYRQLEKRAAERGEVLPRSTLADVLRGNTSPRPDLLAAFARACGDGERVALWLEVWEDVRGKGVSGAVKPPVPGGRSLTGRNRRLLALAVMGLSALAVIGVVMVLLTDDEGSPPVGTSSALPSGWVRIRLAHAPELCLTDGRVLDRRYTPLVAVQRPCDETGATGPAATRVLPAIPPCCRAGRSPVRATAHPPRHNRATQPNEPSCPFRHPATFRAAAGRKPVTRNSGRGRRRGRSGCDPAADTCVAPQLPPSPVRGRRRPHRKVTSACHDRRTRLSDRYRRVRPRSPAVPSTQVAARTRLRTARHRTGRPNRSPGEDHTARSSPRCRRATFRRVIVRTVWPARSLSRGEGLLCSSEA
jgi:hypothetical protein